MILWWTGETFKHALFFIRPEIHVLLVQRQPRSGLLERERDGAVWQSIVGRREERRTQCIHCNVRSSTTLHADADPRGHVVAFDFLHVVNLRCF